MKGERVISLLWAGSLTLVLLLGQVAAVSPSVALLLTLLLLAAGVFWLLKLRQDGAGFAATPFDLPLLLFTLLLVVTSHFSLDPVRSFRLAWSWLAVISSFYIFVTFFRLYNRRNDFYFIVSIVLFLFIVLGYVELVPQLLEQDFVLNAVHRLAGFTGSPNILGFFVAVGMIVQFDQLRKKGLSRSVPFLWLLLAIPILLLSRSRSALMAVAVGAGVLLIIQRFKIDRPRPRQTVAVTIGGALTAGLAIWAILQLRPESFLAGTGSVRLTLWQTALAGWWANPLLGSGLDTFSTLNLLANRPLDTPLFLRAAHSLWFSILVGTGVVGVLLSGWIGVQAARTFWHQRHDLKNQAIPVGVGAAFLLHATLDTPEPWILFLVAVIVASFRWPVPQQSGLVPLFPVALWLVVIGSGIYAYSVTRHYEDGLALAAGEQWGAAADAFDRATTIGPYRDSAALLASGLTHATAGNNRSAIDRFEQLIRQEPGWPGSYVNLAVLYEGQGRPVEAQKMIRIAADLAPKNNIIDLNRRLLRGQPPPAELPVERDPFWQAAAAGEWAAAATFRQQLPNRQPLADGILALESGDRQTAQAFFAEAVPLERSLDAHLWQSWSVILETDPNELEPVTKAQLNGRTLLGVSPNLAAVYPRTIFSRPGLSFDLVPGAWCPASHPTIDLHLAILRQIQSSAAQPLNFGWIEPWQRGTHPTFEGLVLCHNTS